MSVVSKLGKKKLIIIIISFVLVVSIIGAVMVVINLNSNNHYNTDESVVYDDSEIQGDGDNLLDDGYVQVTEVPDGYIGIYNLDDLKNSGINKDGKYILMTDIDMSSEGDWDGIINLGGFEGNLHTISNLTSKHSGLFKNCHNVQHLTLENVDISINEDELDDYEMRVGAIADYCSGYIYNCSTSGNISCIITGKNTTESAGKEYNSSAYIGGIAGTMFNDSDLDEFCINQCESRVNIKVENNATGIYNMISDTTYMRGTSFAGGIVGMGDANLELCTNYGEIDVYAPNIDDADGLFLTSGMCAGGGLVGLSYDSIISNSYNYGDVKSSCNSGGIVGLNHGQLDISNTSNIGSVKCDSYPENSACGGILGRFKSYDEDCVLYNNTNVGEIIPNAPYSGSIVGAIDGSLNVDGCYYIDNRAYDNDELKVSGTGDMFANNNKISVQEAKDQFGDCGLDWDELIEVE